MRNTKQMLNSFMPKHEKEWEAKLIIDEAIKSNAEYKLEAIARALSGKNEVKFSYTNKDKPFEQTEHICGNDEKWIEKTSKYLIEARMREFVFYGNSEIDIWLKVIDFWAGKVTIFPCGGANF